ncbi:DUF4232 domain-containing protein [Streptomyces prasinus]|uniref:DUF4232 domain-containing protein n=1 Tax=Streptomyces prasinus TaxID=67345 RepID=UPI00332434DC
MSTPVRTRRKHTEGWKPYVVGAAVIAALLSSTACQPDAAGDSGGTKPSERPSKAGPAKPGGTASPEPDGASDDTGGTGGGEENGGSGAVAACTEEQLAVSSEKARANSEETRHLVLIVQNLGEKACDLYHSPHVKLGDDAQAMVPLIEDSDPDPDVPTVTVDPGGEAYVALLVSGGGRDEYEAHHVYLTLQGPEPGSSAGKPMDVPLPVDTLYADDGQLVTYWTTASGGALDFIMSK